MVKCNNGLLTTTPFCPYSAQRLREYFLGLTPSKIRLAMLDILAVLTAAPS